MQAAVRTTLILALAASAATAGAQQAYRWTDPATGRTVISDTPPPGNAKNVNKSRAPGGDDSGQTFAVRRAAESFPVTLYTSADCVADCKQARDLLNGRGVPFTEKMLQKQEDIDELKKLVGDVFVPTLQVGRQATRGLQAEAWNNVLDLAGYPKSAPPGSKPSGGLAK